MKKYSSIRSLALLILTSILFGCGETKQDPIEVSPLKFVVKGELEKYFEIVDGNYKLEQYNDNDYQGFMVQVEVKRNNIDFPFGIDSVELMGPVRTDLYIDFTDENGKPIIEFDDYNTIDGQQKKLINSSLNSSIWVTFARNYKSSTWNRDKEMPILPKEVVKFKVYSTLEFKKSIHITKSNKKSNENETEDVNNDNNSLSNDNEENKNVDWDEVLIKYEKFADDYIKHTKKIVALQEKGDNMSLTEVSKLMPKSMQLNQDALELSTKLSGASGDLTGEQMKRFTKIQAKFTKAVLELSTK